MIAYSSNALHHYQSASLHIKHRSFTLSSTLRASSASAAMHRYHHFQALYRRMTTLEERNYDLAY